MNSSIDPIIHMVINAYLIPDDLDSESARVLKLWLENHPREVSHSPMLKDLKNRITGLNTGSLRRFDFFSRLVSFIQKIAYEGPPGLLDTSAIERKIISGRFYELVEYFNGRPEELIKNLELIQTHLDLKTVNLELVLPLLLDQLSTMDLTDLLSSRLNALSAFTRLSKSQFLRLSALLAKPEFANDRLVSLLPPYAQNFLQILQYENISGLAGITEEEKYAALALYIEHHKISLRDIKLNSADFLRLAPHLRYVDLQKFTDIPLANELLQKCSNLNVLLIDNDKMLENVSSLPLCEKLYCAPFTIMEALPNLPLCKELYCSYCRYLKQLPELPLCKKLYCDDCTSLEALPKLPLCNELHCSGGSPWCRLKQLPELPLCKELKCSGCINLEELPALPLCVTLNCNGCTNLQALPALPLCETLNCCCTNLQALPELPLCKELGCSGTKLQALPALPLCKELNCRNTNLQTLPALLLCEKLVCTCCSYLQTLPALPLCKELECSRTHLQALPALPLCGKLVCTMTDLDALPELPLCKNLYCVSCTNLQTLPALPLCEELYCSFCTNLRALPELPLCNELHCSDCTCLTTLPLSLGQNARLTTFDISGTRIEPTVRNAILNQCRLMRDADAVKILPYRLAKWKAIAKNNAVLDVKALSDDQKKTLNEWLLRLERTKDFGKSQTLLAQTVCNIIADLLKNKKFKDLFFPQAEANNVCCEDRSAMSLNEIYTSWKIICTSETLPLKVMTGVAKTLSLRKELQKLIKGNEGESVEIFLYYESTLRERLGLETAIQNMTYRNIGKRDWINEDKLVQDVEAHFFEELFEIPVFEKMLLTDDRMKKQLAKINSAFSTKLEALGDCAKGAPDDPQVLNYQHRQGEIMQEWKREKKSVAKKWYDQALS